MTQASTLSPQAALQLEVWGTTDVGRTREGNEDSIFPDSLGQSGFMYNPRPDALARKGQLLIVADGVGGAQGGRAASQWAIQRAVERYYDLPGADLGADLHAAVAYANASLVDYLQHQQMTDAGCTMTAAVIHGAALYVANVGDSRTYLIRAGRAYPLTKDHTLTQQKIDQRQLRPEDAPLDPDKSVLTRSMGAAPAVQVDLFRQALQPGDRVLLCSDGLHDMVSDAEIAQGATSGPPKRATARLIAEANRRGGFDNISVVLAQVGHGASYAGSAWSTDIMRIWQSWTPKQQKFFIGFGIAVVTILMGLCGWVSWSLFGDKDTSDGTPVPTIIQATQASVTELPQISSSPTPQLADATEPAINAPVQETAVSTTNPTATLKPTSTPTSTPTPRPTNTHTSTPTPETPIPPSVEPPIPPESPTDPAPTEGKTPPPVVTQTP